MNVRRLRSSAAVLALSAVAAGGTVHAQYPVRPIRMIVPFTPGGNADIVARIVARRLGERMGQQVVVDNRGGAGGLIGEEVTARAAPDGYTIALVAVSHSVNPALHKALPFDPVRDFASIAQLVSVPNVLVVHPQVAARSVPELVALAKAKPEGLGYGSSGNGTSLHLAGELFKSMTGANLLRVVYKGSAPAATDLFAGRIDLMFDVITTGMVNARAGRVRALGVTSAKRSTVAPDVPAIAEFVPGYEMTGWQGLIAPKGTAPAQIAQLNRSVVEILAMPDVRDRFLEMGAEPVGSSPAQFAAFVAAEVAKWRKVLAQAGIRAE